MLYACLLATLRPPLLRPATIVPFRSVSFRSVSFRFHSRSLSLSLPLFSLPLPSQRNAFPIGDHGFFQFLRLTADRPTIFDSDRHRVRTTPRLIATRNAPVILDGTFCGERDGSTSEISRHIIVTVKRAALLRRGLARARLTLLVDYPQFRRWYAHRSFALVVARSTSCLRSRVSTLDSRL